MIKEDNKVVNMFYIENNTVSTVIEGYKTFFYELFMKIGYRLKIIISKNIENQNYEFSIDKEHIDIIVSDIKLGTNNYIGLDLIKKLKEIYPEIPVIAFTESDISYTTVASKIPSFDLLIHKSKKNNLDYMNYISNKIKNILKVNVILNINYEESDLEDYMKFLGKKAEFERLLKKITFSSHNAKKNICVSEVKLKKIPSGKSKSQTFRMYSKTEDEQYCINTVLKVSELYEAEKEFENYYNYVYWYLPYTWRPEMISYAMGKNIGMLCYSFVYDDEVPFNSLTDYIKDKNIDIIDFAIDKMFKPLKKKWYSSKNKILKNESINKYYSNKFITNDDKFYLIEFKKLASEYGLSIFEEFLSYKNQNYPLPTSILARDIRNKYYTHISHGDLNSNNILISRNKNLIFIDFQETGFGHVFLDFIVLETCLKLHCEQFIDFEQLILLESKLSSNEYCEDNEINLNPIFRLMKKVRLYAFENSPKEDKVSYYLGITLCCYKLISSKYCKWQKKQLMACILANLANIHREMNLLSRK